MSSSSNETIALQWLAAFNEHHLENLLALYDDNAEHYSPKLKIRMPETNGIIFGKPALRKWWQDAFSRFPELHYKVENLTANEQRIFMEYTRQVPDEKDLMVAEVLAIKDGKIISSKVYHG